MSKAFKIIILVIFIIAGLFFYNLFEKYYNVPKLGLGMRIHGVITGVNKYMCGVTGGDWVSAGCGIADCDFECIQKYSDGGKTCTNSGQCKGDCVVTSPDIDGAWNNNEPLELKQCEKISSGEYRCPNMKIISECQKLPLRCMDYVWLYDNGLLKFKMRGCAAG